MTDLFYSYKNQIKSSAYRNFQETYIEIARAFYKYGSTGLMTC